MDFGDTFTSFDELASAQNLSEGVREEICLHLGSQVVGGPRVAEEETPPVLTVAVILVLVLPKEKNPPRVQAE